MDDTYENAFQLAATRHVPGSSLNDTTIPAISDVSHISTDGASEPVIPLATTKFKTPLPAIPSNIQSRGHVTSNTYTTAMEQNARFRGVNPCQSDSERLEYDTAVSDHVVAGKGKNTPPGNKSRIVVYILLGLSIALSIVALILFFVIGQQENEEIKAMKGIIESLQTNLTAQTSEIKIMKLNVDAQASEIKNANALINILQSNTAVLSTGIDNNDKDIERLEANLTAQASDVQTIAGQLLRSVVLLAEGLPVTNLRLAGTGSNFMQGRVEVYKAGIWGTVCDDSWDINDGNVVCRQLGFSRAIVVTSYASVFGQGSGPIWMDDIFCSGSESSIWACSYSEIHDCNHSEDAGVYCTY